ncbi:MAG: serine--tRNA ligase, partial [Duncaniella sp.]|nr:serine--tRNA ligase [Duncaniella sp.]
MLTLQQIKENPEGVIARLAVKGFDGKQGVNDVIDFDDRRKSLQFQADTLAAELKKKSDSIGRLMKEGRREEAEEAKKEV